MLTLSPSHKYQQVRIWISLTWIHLLIGIQHWMWRRNSGNWYTEVRVRVRVNYDVSYFPSTDQWTASTLYRIFEALIALTINRKFDYCCQWQWPWPNIQCGKRCTLHFFDRRSSRKSFTGTDQITGLCLGSTEACSLLLVNMFQLLKLFLFLFHLSMIELSQSVKIQWWWA